VLDSSEAATATDAIGWAASGAMALTGCPGTAPLVPQAPVYSRLLALADEVAALTARLGRRVDIDPGLLLSGRAALLGLQRSGRTSPNGSCRLLEASDGWLAINLARPSDVDAVDAIVGEPVVVDPWLALASAASRLQAGELAARAQLLGVPAAPLASRSLAWHGRDPWRLLRIGERRARPVDRLDELVVVDLSSMWAGPVCAQLLGRAGARVIKVESVKRPDGARDGIGAFFDWLHAGHQSVALDFDTEAGRDDLLRLVARADIVIESSRPRALRQLGVDAERVVGDGPGRTWVSITGYGRDHDDGDRVAFGDDAAVAGGLVAYDAEGAPVFCGDAIADPLTGLHAALAALTAIDAGGGAIIDVAMSAVAAGVVREPSAGDTFVVERTGTDRWEVRDGRLRQEVLAPRAPVVQGRAPSLGEHTAQVLAEL
jgi:crotonobetainyl-CoA:carnitine CoA-transferase CaiB-like acyl-CoA transferase